MDSRSREAASGAVSLSKRLLWGGFTLLSLLGLAILLTLPLGWREQAVFSIALILIALILDRASRAPAVPLTLMAISVFSTLRYGYWRTAQTWDGITSAGHLYQWDTVFVVLLLLAEFYAFLTLVLGYFQTLRPLGRQPVALEGDSHSWPTVDVFIPTYNEPLGVVRATVLGALAMDYPADKKKVFVLDDGRREEFRQFAASVGAVYLTRDGNAHAKAGNINHALARTSAEYVASFDCDHVPTRSFLQATLGWFARDPRLGLVQTPHHFYSPDPIERNLGQFRRIPNESELFHRLIQDGNDLWNATMFCGSCAVMRRKALDEIGGVAVETVTEDAHTSLRIQRRGWNSALINMPLAAGLATESLGAHIGQRIRWARGMVQILRTENPLFGPGLSIAQRFCYFNEAVHFLFAVPRLIFLTVPLTYLLFGMVNIYGYSLAVLAYALPHIVLSKMANARVQGRYRFSFWSEVYETVLAPYILAPTLLALVNPRLGRFNVTSKGGVINRSHYDFRIALPLLILLALNIAGLFMAGHRWAVDPAHHDSLVMNVAWTTYNIIILSVAASIAWETRQRRSEVRVDVPVQVTLLTANGRRLAGAASQLSRGGVAVHLESQAGLPEGASVVAVLNHQGLPCEIAARVAHASGVTLRLAFSPPDRRQEGYLLGLIYSRPDAWLSWHGSRPPDRPLRCLLQITGLGIRGLALVLLVIVAPRFTVRRRRKRVPAIATLVALSVLLRPVDLEAARAQRPGDIESTPRSTTFQESYAFDVIGAAKGITLDRAGASRNLFFDIPLTKIVSKAALELRYNSSATGESTLQLWLNGTRLAPIRLPPGRNVQADVPLATDLLITENTLTIQLGGPCDGCAAQEATRIVIEPTSTLTISGSRLLLQNDLSLLPIPFFDSTAQRSWALPVVFSGRPDPATLQAAAVVASWFGVFSDVRGVRFPVRIGDLPDGNAVVLVLANSELARRLSISDRSGPSIAIRENPRDAYGKLLIVAGSEPGDLLAAARALVTRKSFPQESSVNAPGNVNAPVQERRSAPRWLATDRPAAIGRYTTAERLTLHGSGSLNIYFRLPPDLFLAARPSVPLFLKFAYTADTHGTRPEAHVRLNGQDVDTIRLRPSSSKIDRAEIVRLPTGTLRPYANELTVDFDFGRLTQPTDVPQYAAIGRDSWIDLRGIPHSVVLPRLELFADSGFPFTEWPDLSRTAVVLPNAPTLADDEAVLDTAGFFGAQTGSPAISIEVVDAARVDTVRDKDLVVLGPPRSQPLLSEWAGSLPLQFNADGPRVNSNRTLLRFLHPEWPFRSADDARLAAVLAPGPLPEMIVEQFVSPFRRDRSVVVIVPGEQSNYRDMAGLYSPAVRNGPVYGAVALVRGGQFESFLVGNLAVHSGDPGPRQRAIVFLFENYRLLPLVVVVLALVVAVAVRRGTERVAGRRMVAKM
jgi:cellulose synthase (UDP-forming)